MRRLLTLALIVTLGLAVGCGSGSGGGSTPVGVPTTVTLSPSAGQFVASSGTLVITAAVATGLSNTAVNWTLSGPGTLSSKTANPVTYTAPSSVTANTPVVVTATAAASSSSTAYLPLTVLPAASVATANVLAISVDGGPAPPYPDGAFTSVTICSPGTTTCQTVDGILVDTGSEGLRVLSSEIANLSLTTLTDSNGNVLNDCAQFGDGSFTWGPVGLADVRISGEVAGGLPVQVISGTPPSGDCTGNNENTAPLLGANGILGIGLEPTDCYIPGTGSPCDSSTGLAGSPPPGTYYTCSSSGCSAAFVPVSDQVAVPTVYFSADNNGTVVTFPALAGSAATLDGTLSFGIGTQTNNVLGSAVPYGVDANDNFVTLFVGQTLTSSFIDSGSNGLFFPSALTVCTDNASFYCAPLATTATNEGASGTPIGTVNITIDDADTLFLTGDSAFSTLGGPNGTVNTCAVDGSGSCSFDFGLPFFFGRSVFTAVDGQTTTAGTGPFWAY